jgi:asparagine synthase (glutamine-hydrolysing)
MCGIVGIYNFDRSQPIFEQQLLKMTDSIAHRGEDGFGFHINRNIGIGHRRLSIIDLSEGGKQPFLSVDGKYGLTFNGEIFNYKELRSQLKLKGITFKTESDTEVLLNLLILYGEDCLEMLNGMFSFAFASFEENKMLICRDRVGVKPLFYSVLDGSLLFASEPKALIKGGVNKNLNNEFLDELLIHRYIAGENTVFANVKRLLPGHLIRINANGFITKKWWDLESKILNNRLNLPKDPFAWFEEIFLSSVSYRTISDVPLGLMLSGGLDSGAIAVALNKIKQTGLSAFTVTFKESQYNEGFLAEKVAKKFGLNYIPIELTGRDLRDSIREASYFYDEPLVHQNDAQMLELSKIAKKSVTVLLSGEGGDELLGGYVRYKPLNSPGVLNILKMISPILNHIPNNGIVNRFNKLSRYLSKCDNNSLVLYNSSDLFPADFNELGYSADFELSSDYRNSLLKEAQRIFPNEMARQAMYLDLFIHMSSVLDRNDRMTMGAGIECRVPFLDYRLLEMIPALPSNYLLKGKKGKYLLVNSIAKELPTEVLKFKKLGFSVPWENYFLTDDSFKGYLADMENKAEHEIFPSINPSKLRKNFLMGNTLSSMLLRHLFMVDEWKEVIKER